MAIYFNDGTNVKKASRIYFGIGNKGKKIYSIYYGVGGKGKQIYVSGIRVATLSSLYNQINNYSIKTKIMPEVETYGYLQTPESKYKIVTPDSSEALVQTDWGEHYIGPGNIYTKADKIEIKSEVGGIFYVGGSGSSSKYINLNDFIFNNCTNFASCFSSRTITGPLENVNFNNGRNFYSAFQHSNYYCPSGFPIQKLNVIIQALDNTEYGIRFCFFNSNYRNIDLNFQVIPSEAVFFVPFQQSQFNSVNLTGNFNVDQTRTSHFGSAKINELTLNVTLNTANNIFIDSYHKINSFKGKITSSYFYNCFYGREMKGYLYLDFPSDTFNVSNIIQQRDSSSVERLYLKVKNQDLAKNIYANIKKTTTGTYSWTLTTDYMPDDSYNKYSCYYNDKANIHILYGDPIP